MVLRINSDLSADVADLTASNPLEENRGVSFIGTQKTGPFDVSGSTAREWLRLPSNPNGRPNADVVKPWMNGMDVVRRPSDRWIVDFGCKMSEAEASLYQGPFEHTRRHVWPLRKDVRRDGHRRYWWRLGETRPGMRATLLGLSRYIATPRVAKHRIFVWLDAAVLPDCQLVVVGREDDFTFGVLHSRFHEAWALRLGTSLEDRPRYTPSSIFETYPFPAGMTPDVAATSVLSIPTAKDVAEAGTRLDALRMAWLNPPELVRVEPEVVPGFPDRLLPVDEISAKQLAKRTLTTLYNERPTWLDNAHAELDAAVATAYGWPADISTEDALARLLELNLERSSS